MMSNYYIPLRIAKVESNIIIRGMCHFSLFSYRLLSYSSPDKKDMLRSFICSVHIHIILHVLLYDLPSYQRYYIFNSYSIRHLPHSLLYLCLRVGL